MYSILYECILYWPEEDACFDGTVRGSDGRVHAVEYDDGDKYDELLGGEDAPLACVV